MPQNKGDLAAEFRRLRKLVKPKLTQEGLAEKLGVTQGVITHIETGRSKFLLASDFAAKVSKALGVDLSHWAPFTSDGHIAGIAPEPVAFDPLYSSLIPHLGKVAAGKPLDPDTRPRSFTDMGKIFTGTGLVTIEVVGDSMNEFGIFDGDMAVVRQVDEAPRNSVVLAWVPSDVGGGLTIKRYADGMLYPESTNDAHEPIELPRDARIYGTYEGLVRRHRPVKKQRRRV